MVDWQLVIGRNREALLRIVALLFDLVGLDEDTPAVATLPRVTRNRVLRLLRPAESALRRLIVIAAREVKVVLPPLSPLVGEMSPLAAAEGGTAMSAPGTPLCLHAQTAGPSHGSRPVLRTPPQGERAGAIPAFPLLDPRLHARPGDPADTAANALGSAGRGVRLPPPAGAQPRAGRSRRPGQAPRPLAGKKGPGFKGDAGRISVSSDERPKRWRSAAGEAQRREQTVFTILADAARLAARLSQAPAARDRRHPA